MSKKQKSSTISYTLSNTLSNEWNPEDKNTNWTKEKTNKNFEYFKYNSDISNIVYAITTELIDKAKKIQDVTIQEKDKDKDIDTEYYFYKFYKVYDFVDTTNCEIIYSRLPIEKIILNDIVNHNKPDSRLSRFIDLTKVKYKVLSCYKVNKDVSLVKELNDIKKKLKEENNILDLTTIKVKKIDKDTKENKDAKDPKDPKDTKDNIETIIEKSKIFLNKIVNKTVEPKLYYIYKLKDQTNIQQQDSTQYILGSFEKLKKRDIDIFVDNNCITFESGKIKSEIIKEVKVHSEVEGKILVDEEINKNNSIKSGLNRYYNIISNGFNQDELFMLVQHEKLSSIFKDNIIKEGFIASINIDDKIYIFSGYNTYIQYKLNEFYHMKRHCEYRYKKIIDLLKVTKIEDIKINLLEKNIDSNLLDLRLLYHLNQYDKDLLLNYNDEFFAKPEDVKKVNSLFYSMKFSKKK